MYFDLINEFHSVSETSKLKHCLMFDGPVRNCHTSII